MNRGYFFFLLFLLIRGSMPAQDCDLTIVGHVNDRATGEPLEFANVFLEEQTIGAVTDRSGGFSLHNICPGRLHIRISHIGCEPKTVFVDVQSDTLLEIILDHHSEVLHEVEVSGERDDFGSATSRSSLSASQILEAEGETLGKLVSEIPGVSSLSSGSNISKPVIHGLYGNRITLIQNGLNLSSQRWGNDHSPEIAMSGADKITVLKGVDAIRVGSEGLGGAIVVENRPILNDPHWHGWVNYGFASNGRKHSASMQLKKKIQGLSAKFSGGLTRSGDLKTPNYFLTNTGSEEYHVNISLHHQVGDASDLQLNYTLYTSELGILRGAHLGNTTDLEEAIAREVPFYTKSEFSYDLLAPRQSVEHHTVGLKCHIGLSQNSRLEVKSGFQLNNRQEFDVRRGGRTTRPSLDLRLLNQQNSIDLHSEFGDWKWSSGFSSSWSLNTNDPQTGIQPLIPDYVQLITGLYSTLKKSSHSWTYEAGMRYDFRYFSVALAPSSSQDSINRFKHNFHNLMGSIGLSHQTNEHFNWSLNGGITQRQPHINELYSSGLHQGVAGIEEGDRTLKHETSYKILGRMSWHTHWHALIELGVYSQWIHDYIYLEPEDELRLTIRGAFPVFRYKQNDVNISGLDFKLSTPLGKSLEYFLHGQLIVGENLVDSEPLIYMPPNQLKSGLTYQLSAAHWSGHIQVEGEYVFQQHRHPEELDFLPPPDGVFLLHAEARANIEAWGQSLVPFARAENILNRRYRNYLNRWRYFADEPGLNVRLGLRWKF